MKFILYTIIMNRMKDKTVLGNTGNVLHEYDETS
jgi:hypothetical protein